MAKVELIRALHFIEVKDEQNTYYGGDQEWFGFTVGMLGGCGTVAAANIVAYMTGDKMDKTEYVLLMNDMYHYVKPHKIPFLPKNRKPWRGFGWTIGVWPSIHLIWGMQRYAKTHRMKLRPVRISCKRTKEELVEYIREGLAKDCPIAMLIGWNYHLDRKEVCRPDGSGWNQTNMSNHWVTITQMRTEPGGKVRLKVSTWGGWTYLDLEEWLAWRRWPQAMVYFIKT